MATVVIDLEPVIAEGLQLVRGHPHFNQLPLGHQPLGKGALGLNAFSLGHRVPDIAGFELQQVVREGLEETLDVRLLLRTERSTQHLQDVQVVEGRRQPLGHVVAAVIGLAHLGLAPVQDGTAYQLRGGRGPWGFSDKHPGAAAPHVNDAGEVHPLAVAFPHTLHISGGGIELPQLVKGRDMLGGVPKGQHVLVAPLVRIGHGGQCVGVLGFPGIHPAAHMSIRRQPILLPKTGFHGAAQHAAIGAGVLDHHGDGEFSQLWLGVH